VILWFYKKKIISGVHNVRFIKIYSIFKAKRLKILKGKNQTFSAVCHHQGSLMMANSQKRLVFTF